ncbi:MAG: hypothetical protein EZS28_039084, partial [Streblomastix strix]
MIVPNWQGQVRWTKLKEITAREKELGESEKGLEIGSKMKKKNLKVPPGRILALEVNGAMVFLFSFQASNHAIGHIALLSTLFNVT